MLPLLTAFLSEVRYSSYLDSSSLIKLYQTVFFYFTKAKRVETIQRQWQQAFMEAAWHQPSVILLDNLDHVISAPNLAQEMGGEGFYRKRLVEGVWDTVSFCFVMLCF
jgi:hypothetical protein